MMATLMVTRLGAAGIFLSISRYKIFLSFTEKKKNNNNILII